jgi:hypothetical protein
VNGLPSLALAGALSLVAGIATANIGVGEPAADISCDVARAKVANPDQDDDQAAHIAYASRDLACRMAALNAEPGSDKHVVVATYDAERRTMRFVPVLIEDRDAVRSACRLMAVVGAAGQPAEAGPDDASTTLEGRLGTSDCEGYLRQASQQAPMLIVVPNLVPGTRLTLRDWRELTRLFGTDGERLQDSVAIGGDSVPLTIVPPAAAAARSACHLLEC